MNLDATNTTCTQIDLKIGMPVQVTVGAFHIQHSPNSRENIKVTLELHPVPIREVSVDKETGVQKSLVKTYRIPRNVNSEINGSRTLVVTNTNSFLISKVAVAPKGDKELELFYNYLKDPVNNPQPTLLDITTFSTRSLFETFEGFFKAVGLMEFTDPSKIVSISPSQMKNMDTDLVRGIKTDFPMFSKEELTNLPIEAQAFKELFVYFARALACCRGKSLWVIPSFGAGGAVNVDRFLSEVEAARELAKLTYAATTSFSGSSSQSVQDRARARRNEFRSGNRVSAALGLPPGTEAPFADPKDQDKPQPPVPTSMPHQQTPETPEVEDEFEVLMRRSNSTHVIPKTGLPQDNVQSDLPSEEQPSDESTADMAQDATEEHNTGGTASASTESPGADSSSPVGGDESATLVTNVQ